jgi:hypothetical protein
LVGLKDLSITYPEKLGDTLSPDYTFENFKEEFAKTLSVNGMYNGIKLYNDKTYVTNIKYELKDTKKYTYGSTYDTKDANEIVRVVENEFNTQLDSISQYDYSVNNIEYILSNDAFYYYINRRDINRFDGDVEKFYLQKDKVFVVQKIAPFDSGLGINYFTNGVHRIRWCIKSGTNSLNITKNTDFFDHIPYLTKVTILKDGVVVGSKIRYTARVVTKTGDVISGPVLDIVEGDQIYLTINNPDNVDHVSTFPLDGKLSIYEKIIRVFNENLSKEYPVFVKDRTLYHDIIDNYKKYAYKLIKDIHINEDTIHVVFKDI